MGTRLFGATCQQETAKGLMFSVGKKVEVTFDTGGAEHSWFPATVLEHKENSLFLVECQKLNTYGEPWKVQETLDSFRIRPCPPHLKEKNYFLLEKVDAFYDLGWRTGVITKELADSRYIVFFKHTEKEREFSYSELRPHMEWKDGKWFTSSQRQNILTDTGGRRFLPFLSVLCELQKDASSFPSAHQNNEGHDESVNVTGMVTTFGSSIPTEKAPDKIMPSSLTSGEKRIDLEIPCSNEDLNIEFSLMEKISEPLDLVSRNKSELEIQSGASSPSTSTDTVGIVNEGKLSTAPGSAHGSENENASQCLHKDLLSVNPSWRKILKRKQICSGEQEDVSVVCSRKSSENSMDARVKRIRPSLAGKEYIDVEGAAEDVQKKKSMTIKTTLPIILGLACDSRKSSGSKYSSQSNKEEAVKYIGDWACLDEAKLHTVKVTNQFDVEDRSHKEWKGRLPKPFVKSSIISFSDFTENEDDPLMDVEIAKSMDAYTLGQVCGINCRKKLMDIKIKQETDSGSDSMSLLRIGRGDLIEASINQCERYTLKRGVVSPNTVNEKVAEANCATGIPEVDSEESPNNPFDAQLLTTSIRDDSPTTLDSSRPSEARNAEQSAEASGGPMEIIDEAPTRVDEEGGLASEFQCLPFVKTSPLWSTIESVEVFQKRPQKPHFRPLKHCKESLREGLAIGCMVTFSSVVERISKLQFDVPHVPMDDILETLQELETHGFSIGFVRDRIGDLRYMREKHEKLKEEMEEVSKEMISRNLENSKIDEEMDKIYQQIKGLEGMLSEAVSRKEMKSREIGSLQSKLKGITEGIRSVQHEFDDKGTCLL